MTKTKWAGSVATEDRPERVLRACESLILRPPESTREGVGGSTFVSWGRERPVREPFPRASLRRFKGWPAGLLAFLEAGWRPERLRGAA